MKAIIRILLAYFGAAIIVVNISEWFFSKYSKSIEIIRVLESYKKEEFIVITTLFLFYLLKKEKNILEKERDENYKNSEVLKSIVDNSNAIIYLKDRKGKYLSVNSYFEEMMERKEREVLGKKDTDLFSNIYIEFFKSDDSDIVKNKSSKKYEKTIKLAGKTKTYFFVKFPIFEKNGSVKSIGTIANDISEFADSREELNISKKFFENSKEGIVITNKKGLIQDVNRVYCKITGYDKRDLMYKSVGVMKSFMHKEDYYKKMWHEIDQDGKWKGEIWNRKKNGELYPGLLSISSIFNEANEITHYIGVLEDLTEQKARQENIEELTNFDSLTNLPNQIMYRAKLREEMQKSKKARSKIGVLNINLDDFKIVNDSLGYYYGDQLIIATSKRLQESIGKKDVIARVGGDEFLIMLKGIEKVESVTEIAEKIVSSFDKPFDINGREVFISLSVGIGFYPMDGLIVEEILQNVSKALHYAKSQGKNSFQFFSEDMRTASLERLELSSALRKAVDNNEFELYYQPQVCTKTEKIIGAEALVRWIHPEKGVIPPIKFIPLVESTGLILPLGDWILEEACRQNKEWQVKGLDPIVIAVNMSPKQFKMPDVIDKVFNILEKTGLSSKYLELEITEGVLIENVKAIEEKLLALRSKEIQISLDDFGTGYSSLSYLRTFSITKLKIDRAFVKDIPDNDDGTFSEMIINLGKTLGLQVIAEGVETAEQLQVLNHLGADEIQGYYYSKPIPANEFYELLKKNQAKYK